MNRPICFEETLVVRLRNHGQTTFQSSTKFSEQGCGTCRAHTHGINAPPKAMQIMHSFVIAKRAVNSRNWKDHAQLGLDT